jgi:Fe-S-cluster containining protein
MDVFEKITGYSQEAWHSHLNGLLDFARKSTASAISSEPSAERTARLMAKISRFADSDILRIVEPINALPEEERRQCQPQCAKGCDHCCYQWVRCTVPEALFTFEGLRAALSSEEIGLLREVISEYTVQLVPNAAGLMPQIACPLLKDGACSVYEHRPLICRGVASLDAETCRIGRLHPETTKVPYLMPMMHIAGSLRNGVSAGIKAAGLPEYEVVLALALAILIDDPEAPAKYFAGENVFLSAKAESGQMVRI